MHNLFNKLQPQINRIINEIINYNNTYTKEDYLQEAFLACLQAEKTYSKIREKIRTKMQLPVYCYWLIEKKLHRMADTGEVVFDIYSPEGEFVETLRNGQFRKKKRELEGKGFKIRSTRITRPYEINYGNHNDNGDHSEDHDSDGFELNSLDTLENIDFEDIKVEVADDENANKECNKEYLNI